LFEARNAVRIAHIAAGDKYASSILPKANQQLLHAKSFTGRSKRRNPLKRPPRKPPRPRKKPG